MRVPSSQEYAVDHRRPVRRSGSPKSWAGPPAEVFKTLVAHGDRSARAVLCRRSLGPDELDLKALAAASERKSSR